MFSRLTIAGLISITPVVTSAQEAVTVDAEPFVFLIEEVRVGDNRPPRTDEFVEAIRRFMKDKKVKGFVVMVASHEDYKSIDAHRSDVVYLTRVKHRYPIDVRSRARVGHGHETKPIEHAYPCNGAVDGCIVGAMRDGAYQLWKHYSSVHSKQLAESSPILGAAARGNGRRER